jgi:hypothetical protein
VIVVTQQREDQVMIRFRRMAVAALVVGLLPLTTGSSPNVVILNTAMSHGCSDGSDIVGIIGGRPVTRSVKDSMLWFCDERDDIQGYDIPALDCDDAVDEDGKQYC